VFQTANATLYVLRLTAGHMPFAAIGAEVDAVGRVVIVVLAEVVRGPLGNFSSSKCTLVGAILLGRLALELGDGVVASGHVV
jgi:hypothetical protein